LAKMPKFVELHSKKKAFLLVWWAIGSLGFYALPICAGYFPEIMKIKVVGRLNFGYFFCMFEFFMIWSIALHYTKKANSYFDPLTKEVVAELAKEVAK